MFQRSLRPIALALISFAFLTISGMALFGPLAELVFITPLYAAEILEENSRSVDPLPPGCINGTPAGEDEPVCCISGMIIVNGQPISGAELSIADDQGLLITVTTQVYEGLDPRPQYVIDLSRLTRPVTPTNVITLVASYSGVSSPAVQHVVQPGEQNRDLIVYDPNALAMVGQTPGEPERGKFDRVRHSATDSQGNVYAIDWLNARIQVFSPDGVLLRIFGGPGNEATLFSPRGLSGIAINKRTDIVYIGDTSKQRITQHTTDGVLLGVLEPPSQHRWAFAAIADIQIDAEGYLYVLAYRGGLFRFAPNGTWLSWPQWSNDFYSAWSSVQLAVTPDGKAYAPNGNTLYRFDEGVPVTLTTNLLVTGETLSTTWSIAFNKEENGDYLYVAERPSGTRVIKLSIGSNNDLNQVPWNLQTNPSDPSLRFHSLVIHGSNLYITGDSYHRIWQFGVADGSYRRSWGGLANNLGQVGDPRGLAISPLDDTLYMADCTTGRINRLVRDQIVQSWDALALGIATTRPFFCPVGLTFDDLGHLLMVDNYHKVTRFITNSGQLVFDGEWGGVGVGINQLINPTSVAIDRNKFIYIIDYSNRRIVIAGPVIGTLPAIQTVAIFTGTLPSNQLVKPSSIAIDVDASNPNSVTVYIADPGECQTQPGRLLRLTVVQGKVQQDFMQWGSKGWGDTTGPFICPSSVYVRDGYLYATINYQTSNAFYVYKIDKAGKIVATYGTIGWGPGQFLHPVAVAVNSKGEMWVSDGNNSRLQRFTPMETSDPVATIVHLSASSLVPGSTLTAVGAGQDGDASNQITNYIWTSDRGFILTTNQPSITIPVIDSDTHPDALGRGLHRLQLRVRDNEGIVSAPATVLVFVAQRKPQPPPTPVPTPDVTLPPPPPPAVCQPGSLWTFLLYLDADYRDDGQLARDYRTALTQLDTLTHPCIQVAIQLDGPGAADTLRLYKAPGQPLTASDSLTTEVAMDKPQALSAFIAWGQAQLPADHYYLALADHGDGVRGTLWDHTSDPNGMAYLSVAELREALEDTKVLPIDILHLDSCSMALLEVAYQLRGKVQYLIASQYLGWSFFAYGDYARYAGDYPEPAGLAQQIVKRYGALAANRQLPSTLSVLDLRRIEPVKNGIDNLAVLLKAWVGNDDQSRLRHQQLETIRQNSQRFDSNGSYTNDELDAYVDLLDWLGQLRSANLNSEITAATERLVDEFKRSDKLILENHTLSNPLPPRYAGGQLINLSRATGLSIYYPLEGTTRVTSAVAANNAFAYTQLFADYLDHKLFDFTRASRWDEFLRASFGTPPTDRAQLEPPLPPAAPLVLPQAVYLPLVRR